ncbi:hypothetical protein Pelo_17300 [Pelomyxa schiedti]|nr:hypothetical protein Pelo_17300 [Pelomyxa schiedti]
MSSVDSYVSWSDGDDGTLTDKQARVVVDVRVVVSLISLLSTSIVLGVLFLRLNKNSEDWSTNSAMVVVLLGCSWLSSIANSLSIGLGSQPEPSLLCYIQGMLMQFGEVSEFLMVTVISFHLMWALSLGKYSKWIYKIILAFFVGVCTFLLTLLPIISDYGPAGYWCWITSDDPWWQFGAFYAPLVVCMSVTMGFYVAAFLAKSKSSTTDESKMAIVKDPTAVTSEEGKLWGTRKDIIVYPGLFIIVWIAPLGNRIQTWVSNEESFAWYMAQVCTEPALGLLNSIFTVILFYCVGCCKNKSGKK